jgi:hypothetical protein
MDTRHAPCRKRFQRWAVRQFPLLAFADAGLIIRMCGLLKSKTALYDE